MPLKLTGLRTAGLVATRDCAAFSTSPLETAQRSTLFLRRAAPQSRPPSKTQTSTTPLVTRCTGSRRLRWHIGHQRPRADSRVRALAANIHGVLGQEFLSHFDYLLDFAGHRLVFGGPVPDGGSRAVMNLVDGRPTVETDRGKLVLDSGTETAILFGASSTGSARRIVTGSGSASVSAVQNLRLRIAGRVYATAAASLPRVSPQEDGLLPASLFHAVYVSNSGKYLVLDPATRSNR